jgi:lipopolysaccharide heptosyltransferase II
MDPAGQEYIADGGELLKLHIDKPRMADNAIERLIRGSLFIEGWALACSGVASIDIAVDGEHVNSARYGLPRSDIAEAHPDWLNARNSGFAVSIPGRSLVQGRHNVRVILLDNSGNSKEVEFQITSLEEDGLRRKISQAEIDLQFRILSGLDWHPKFCLLMSVGYGEDEVEQAQATLASLREQAYSDWQSYIVPGRRGGKRDELRDRLLDGSENVRTLRFHFQNGSNDRKAWRDNVLDGFDDIADRIEILPKGEVQPLADLIDRFGRPVLFGVIGAGDELSVDALLEFAVTTGMYRDADFFYSDELRISPVSKAVEPFLKPQWSPDLLLSTNYIGRLWCAKAELMERTGATLDDVFRFGEYDLVLRATEAAGAIRHIPGLLCQRRVERLDSEAMERRALERTVRRRGIAGEILAGRVSGTYRVKRGLITHGLVSIIIPTCASRGLIRTCIETLRKVTAYRNFEIVCIDNVPADEHDWKRWLRANADKVIEIAGPFNWSRFNNRAAEEAAGEYLLFLNDDIEIIEPDWLDALLEPGQRPEIGVAGPQLLYPDRSIQHAGMFLTREIGIARHAFRHLGEHDPGYFGLALTQRNVIAVTGACLLTRTEVFRGLGGFDEAHDDVNNDLDYCLRAWRRGLSIVFTPYAKLIHHECASRSEGSDDYDVSAFHRQWRAMFADGDPYHHPYLSRESDNFVPEPETTRLICAGRPLLNREAVRRILVIKLDHIGDCLTAFPAVRRLRQCFPHADLRVLASRWTKPIWTGADTVDEVIEFDFFHNRAELGLREVTVAELQALRSRLAPYRFDLAVDLRKHLETRPVLQYTGARYLAGFDKESRYPWLDIALEWRGDRAREAHKRQTVGDDLVNLVDAIAASCEPERVRIPQRRSGPLPLPAMVQRRLFTRPFACIHPAAGEKMRQWPPKYFAELIDLLIEREQVNIALIGDRDDQEVAVQVLRAVRHSWAVVNLVGAIKLEDAPDLISRCALFVGNNSGPHHLAAGLGVPTIGVHSAVVDAHEWGPVGPHAIALRREMVCGPCYLGRPEHCHRDLACLLGLRPGEVYMACKRLLAIGIGKQEASRSDVRLSAE